MNIKEAIEKVKTSKAFQQYKEKNPNAYITHSFFMTGNGIDIGFYNPETNLMASFNTKNQEVLKVTEEQPFQKSTKEIRELDLSKVSVTMDEALQAATEFKKEKYPLEMINKEIIILQELDEVGLVYNITFITESFKTLNIKINPESKEILAHSLDTLIAF